MYQQIQLRKKLNFPSNTNPPKVENLEARSKKKNRINFFNDGGESALKELSNEMDELEEVILVEDEPALQLPQLSNECWSNFVEELSTKYEHGHSLNDSTRTSFYTSSSESKSHSRLRPSENTVSTPCRDTVATQNERLTVGIRCDEDDRCSPGKCADKYSDTEMLGTEYSLDSQRNNSGQSNANLGRTTVGDPNHLLDKGISDSKNGTIGGDNNTTSAERLLCKTPIQSKSSHCGLPSTNKKYQEIKNKSYKLTFHQILNVFDNEKSVPVDPFELDFPDYYMREFVRAVKDFQETETAEDVKYLWAQVKIWLSAMKSPYGNSSYTKYHKKLNWYITELMATYINFEIKNITQTECNYKLKMESLTNAVSSLLNDDVKLKILTLLRTDFPERKLNFSDDIFRKFLINPKVRLENSDYGTYRLKVLGFQKWKYYTSRLKNDIVEIAVKDGSAYLPKLVPINSEDPFYKVDNIAQLINEFDKEGTRKLLETDLSADMLKTSIDEYLQVYENQLNDEFGFNVFRRKDVEGYINNNITNQLKDAECNTPRIQNPTSADYSTRNQRHSLQTVPLRHDMQQCSRRRPHCSNGCSNSSRATHLSAGCDMQRNRLSNHLKSNRHSRKLLAGRNQSDTRLSGTKSSNDIISLDSTDDDEDDNNDKGNDKNLTERSKSITHKIHQSSQLNKITNKQQSKYSRHIDHSKPTISIHSKSGSAHLLRKKSLQHKQLDTIVLDSSSDGEETLVAGVKEDENKTDNVVVQQVVPTADPQQTPRAQQRNVSRPLRCALMGRVAIKPVRKEKHCIPGEVSSTTSHDILESDRNNQTPGISSSASLEVNNSSAYENAREVGTVEILDRRELRQPVVMAERCFRPGKLLLGIDYSDDENDDDDAVDRTRDHVTASSDVDGDDDEISNGCVLPIAGYSKVVEEATSSTEIFPRTNSLETEALSTVLRTVASAPLVAMSKEEAPTCSRYAYSMGSIPTELNSRLQKDQPKVMPQADGIQKNLTNVNNVNINEEIPSIASKDMTTRRMSVEGDIKAEKTVRNSNADAEIRNKKNEKEIHKDFDSGIHNEKYMNLMIAEDSVGKNYEVDVAAERCAIIENDDENTAIDKILADIDESLRNFSEINRHLKDRNSTNIEGDLVGNIGSREPYPIDLEHSAEFSEVGRDQRKSLNIEKGDFNSDLAAENGKSVLNELDEDSEIKKCENWIGDVLENSCNLIDKDTAAYESIQNLKKTKSIAECKIAEQSACNTDITTDSVRVESEKVEKESNKSAENDKITDDEQHNSESVLETVSNVDIEGLENKISSQIGRESVAMLENKDPHLENCSSINKNEEIGPSTDAPKKIYSFKASYLDEIQMNTNYSKMESEDDKACHAETDIQSSISQVSLVSVDPKEKLDSASSEETKNKDNKRSNNNKIDNITELYSQQVETPVESKGDEENLDSASSEEALLEETNPSADNRIDILAEPRSKNLLASTESPSSKEPDSLVSPNLDSLLRFEREEKGGWERSDTIENKIEETNRLTDSKISNRTDARSEKMQESAELEGEVPHFGAAGHKENSAEDFGSKEDPVNKGNENKAFNLCEESEIEKTNSTQTKNEVDNITKIYTNEMEASTKIVGKSKQFNDKPTIASNETNSVVAELLESAIELGGTDNKFNKPIVCDINKVTAFISTEPTECKSSAATKGSKIREQSNRQLNEDKEAGKECLNETESLPSNAVPVSSGVDTTNQGEKSEAGERSKECKETTEITKISSNDVPKNNVISNVDTLNEESTITFHTPNENQRQTEKKTSPSDVNKLDLSTTFASPIEEEITDRSSGIKTDSTDVILSEIVTEEINKTPLLSESKFDELKEICHIAVEESSLSKENKNLNLTKSIAGNDLSNDNGVVEAVEEILSFVKSNELEIKDTTKESEEPTMASNQHTNTDIGLSMESRLLEACEAEQNNECSVLDSASGSQVAKNSECLTNDEVNDDSIKNAIKEKQSNDQTEVECGEVKESTTEPILLKEQLNINTEPSSGQYDSVNIEAVVNALEDSARNVRISFEEEEIKRTECSDETKYSNSGDLNGATFETPEIIESQEVSLPDESNTEIVNEINSKSLEDCSIHLQESKLASDFQDNEINNQITNNQTLLTKTNSTVVDEQKDHVTNYPQEEVVVTKHSAESAEISVTGDIDASAKLDEGKCDVHDDKLSSVEASNSKSTPTNEINVNQIEEPVAKKSTRNECDNENDRNNDELQDLELAPRESIQSNTVAKPVSGDRSTIIESKSDETQNDKNDVDKQLVDDEITGSCKNDGHKSDINKVEIETTEISSNGSETSKEHASNRSFCFEKSTANESGVNVEAVSHNSYKIKGKRKRNSLRKLMRDADKRAARKMHIKRRLSQCSDMGMENTEDFNSTTVLGNQNAVTAETAEELAYNISKLVIKESSEEVENIVGDDNQQKQEQESCSLKNNDNLDDANTECRKSSPALLHDGDSELSMQTQLQKELEESTLSEDCHSFQCLPSDYNSEEILAVTTLISMRNKYSSVCSTPSYAGDDNVVAETPQNLAENEDFNEPDLEKTNQKEEMPRIKSALKKTYAKDCTNKKKVHYDEENLMELINEKKKALSKSVKFTKDIKKLRTSEGVLPKGGNKNIKRRLLELNSNLSLAEEDHPIDIIEVIPEVKKKRGRRKVEPTPSENTSEELIVPTEANESTDTMQIATVEDSPPIYPVRLTSRRKNESAIYIRLPMVVKNKKRVKFEPKEKVNTEDVTSDFIVPDEKVAALGVPAKDNITKVSRICIDGTKVKLKIPQYDAVEKPKTLAKDKHDEKSIDKIEGTNRKEKPSLQLELSMAKKAVVKIKRIKAPIYETVTYKKSDGSGATVQHKSEKEITTNSTCKELSATLQVSPAESTKTVSDLFASSSLPSSPKLRRGVASPSLAKSSKLPDKICGTNSSKIKAAVNETTTSKTSVSSESSVEPQSERVIAENNKCTELSPSLQEPSIESSKPVSDLLASTRISQSPKLRRGVASPSLTKSSNLPEKICGANLSKIKAAVNESTTSTTSISSEASAEPQSEEVISENSTCKDRSPSLQEPPIESSTPVSDLLTSTSILPSRKLRRGVAPQLLAESSNLPDKICGTNSSKIKAAVNETTTSKASVSSEASAQPQSKRVLAENSTFKELSTVESSKPNPQLLASTSISQSPKLRRGVASPSLAKSSNLPEKICDANSSKSKAAVNETTTSKTTDSREASTQQQSEEVISENSTCKDLSPSLQEPPIESSKSVSELLASASILPSRKLRRGVVPQSLAKSSNLPDKICGTNWSKIKAAVNETTTSKTSVSSEASAQPQSEEVIAENSTCKDLSPSLQEPPIENSKSVSDSSSISSSPEVIPPPLVKSSSSSLQESQVEAVLKTVDSSKLPYPKVGRGASRPQSAKSNSSDATNVTNSQKVPTGKRHSKYTKKTKTPPLLSTPNTTTTTNVSATKPVSLENINVAKMTEDAVKSQDSNLSTKVTQVIPLIEKKFSTQEQIIAEDKIKTEPLEEIEKSNFTIENLGIKEEEEEEEVPVDASDNLPVFLKRHAKDIILKPSEVILTAEKINEQAEAHRGFRKKQKIKKPEQKGDSKDSNLRSIKRKSKKKKTVIKDSDISARNKETPSVFVELEITKVEETSLEAPSTVEDKCEHATNSESLSIIERQEEDNVNVSKTYEKTASTEVVDSASKTTENVIAELKLLSPENFQNNEDDKEVKHEEPIAMTIDVNIEMSNQSQLPDDTNSCTVEKSDEEKKTAQLLDSSIDIVLGNSTFTKTNLKSTVEEANSAADTIIDQIDKQRNKKSSDSVSFTTPKKNRLDVLTAEKINSVLEKMLEEKNHLKKEKKTNSSAELNVCHANRRQAINEDEGPRKAPSRSSLSSVKEISAKVPEALFADDESESSNADDSTSEQFFAPILSLDDLLIKKDESSGDLTTPYDHQETAEVTQTETVQPRDGLGTPNFTVELEVETTSASNENTAQAQESIGGDNAKVDTQCEETVKCGEGAELNTNLEETDASFSLSAMADISTIDIPSDLTLNNEYPDLLDAMLFEQVRQSIDCMISGTNSAKKWSQDSFATAQTPAQFNHNQIETAPRVEEEEHEVPLTTQEKTITTNDGNKVTASEETLGVGEETFLGTISTLDEVEVPTTGFDLVGSFTIAEFLSEAGSDLFPFPELDKTQSRSNSFSTDSNACNTPPHPFDEAADESVPSSNKKAESDTQLSQNTNSVACDHSYNKDINEAEKLETKVRKKSASSSPPRCLVLQSPQKSYVASIKSPTLLNTFSRSKCHPKPFWKVKKADDDIITSTPKKEIDETPSMHDSQEIHVAEKMKLIVSEPADKSIKSVAKKLTVFSMPALEVPLPKEKTIAVKAAVPNDEVIAPVQHKDTRNISIASSETAEKKMPSEPTESTNLKADISKVSTAPTSTIDTFILQAEVAEVGPKQVPAEEQAAAVEPVSISPKRSATPIEITEVITIPAPVIVQPIIRIRRQTNRLERIDPESEQVFLHTSQENIAKLDNVPNTSSIEINNIIRPARDSTPTLDERINISPTDSIIAEDLACSSFKAKDDSSTQLDEPPAKRACIENANKQLSANEIFDILKREEKIHNRNDSSTPRCLTNKTESSGSVTITDLNTSKSLDTESKTLKELDTTELRKNVEIVTESVASVPVKSCKEESTAILSPNKVLSTKQKTIQPNVEKLTDTKAQTISAVHSKSVEHHKSTLLKTTAEESPKKDTDTKANLKPLKICDKINQAGEKSLIKPPGQSVETCKKQKDVSTDILSRYKQKQIEDTKQVQSKTVLPKPYTSITLADNMNPSPNKTSHIATSPTNVVQVKKVKTATTCSGLPKESNLKIKIKDDIKTTHAITLENVVKNSSQDVAVKSHSANKAKDLQTNEVQHKSEKNTNSPYQNVSISPRTKIPRKPTLAVAPTLLSNNTNRFHPYQKSQVPQTSSNAYRNKTTPQKQYIPVTADTNARKKETTARSDKTTSFQRTPSLVTTLPPMQSRPPPTPASSNLPLRNTTLTPAGAASTKLSPEDEAEIAVKLRSYRAALPTANTYGEHRENQRLLKLQEEKLRLEYVERANRRKSQQLRAEAQRLKRKSIPDSFQSQYKKFSMHSGKPDGASSRSGGHQSRSSRQYLQQYMQRPRPHHEYVNKFGEIEKLVEKEKVTTDSASKHSGPLTASTAWEPKMPTGDELIELFSKTKKS